MEAYRGERQEVLESYLDHQITFSEYVFALEEALARLERREILREFDSVERKLPARVYKGRGNAQIISSNLSLRGNATLPGATPLWCFSTRRLARKPSGRGRSD
jgi:hypothetical protein